MKEPRTNRTVRSATKICLAGPSGPIARMSSKTPYKYLDYKQVRVLKRKGRFLTPMAMVACDAKAKSERRRRTCTRTSSQGCTTFRNLIAQETATDTEHACFAVKELQVLHGGPGMQAMGLLYIATAVPSLSCARARSRGDCPRVLAWLFCVMKTQISKNIDAKFQCELYCAIQHRKTRC